MSATLGLKVDSGFPLEFGRDFFERPLRRPDLKNPHTKLLRRINFTADLADSRRPIFCNGSQLAARRR
jgi:hypothetical protein